MKQSKVLKSLSFFLCVIATSLALTSCSSEKDEPSTPNGGEFPIPTIPYSELSGSWTIESIKDSETGKTVTINQEISIGSFQPIQSKDDLTDLLDYELWAESYDDLISYKSEDVLQHNYAVITFYKNKKEALTSSQVGGLSFSLTTKKNDNLFVQTFVMTGVSLSNKVLTSFSGAYATSDDLMNPIRGTITMRKK